MLLILLDRVGTLDLHPHWHSMKQVLAIFSFLPSPSSQKYCFSLFLESSRPYLFWQSIGLWHSFWCAPPKSTVPNQLHWSPSSRIFVWSLLELKIYRSLTVSMFSLRVLLRCRMNKGVFSAFLGKILGIFTRILSSFFF